MGQICFCTSFLNKFRQNQEKNNICETQKNTKMIKHSNFSAHKILLKHTMSIHLGIICGFLHPTMTKLISYDKDHRTCKT